MWEILLTLILAVILFIVYQINKNIKCIFPYVILILITPIYNFFSKNVLGKWIERFDLKIFDITLTVNDINFIIYSLISLWLVYFGFKKSKLIRDKSRRAAYCISIYLWNVLITLIVCDALILI